MGLVKKDFLISTSKHMWNVIAPYQEILEIGIKTLKHSEQILIFLGRSYTKIGRKPIISYSNKMPLLLNDLKA